MALRILVLLLAVLAGGKVAWQEYTYRTALRDSVAAAYRERAAKACEFDSRGLALGIPPTEWATTDRIEVRIDTAEVWPWPLRSAAHRATQPSLILTVRTARGPVACAYNVVTAKATVEPI